ncbi:endonuclease domain-containing protein [Streptomyces scabiei]|uniref:endonuclease domain-containing protein n=1 Tax=Streptomyces scabiei TaxID=1930 RepID=UPI0004E75282|nr:endonuclease domain-containing protein [Streptomyces scabiei]KFG10875.1 endonuclease VII [Streptomyces scabiei]MDX2836988.1 endonuclease domain-containing protein [Streptomyces scabiei]MDX3681847.1 endonuclease domain-containing protein [Streptomyces scabiei]
MAPISPKLALAYFTELSAGCAVPLALDDLLHMVHLRRHNHVVIGDIALRCYKNKSKWGYDERDIRRAARELADFRLDVDDVVEVQLPAYRERDEQGPEDWGRADWRQTIASWMFWQARDKHQEGRPYEEWDDRWKRIGASGLPGELTWDEFIAARSAERLRQNIANTQPLELMTYSGGTLFLPRAYAELLDRWEQVEEDLVAQARVCRDCAVQGPRWGGWRTPSPLGYVTLCPPCSGAAFQRYTGHLRGVLYDTPRVRGTRADDYLCRLCAETRAAAWDHCHDHGFLRGPLCGSCNTFEGKSSPRYFLDDKEGAALHLLECRGCLERRTLPVRYHVAIVHKHLEATEGHRRRGRRCTRRPSIRHVELAHGTHRFELECWWHSETWTKDVAVPETVALVRDFVDQALAAAQPDTVVPAARAAVSGTATPA